MSDPDPKPLDREVVDHLHANYAGRLKPFLIGLLRDRGLAEEALQNTFQKALSAGNGVDATRWKAWLFQVAHNEAMSIRRRQQINTQALQEIGRTQPQFGITPDQQLINDEQRDRLRAAIHELPKEQRNLILRRLHNDQTFQQIADELSLPLGTVLTRMRLALKKLRRALHEADD